MCGIVPCINKISWTNVCTCTCNTDMCFTKPWLCRCQELNVLMTGRKKHFLWFPACASLCTSVWALSYISTIPMSPFNSGKTIDPAAGAATKWTLREGLESDEMHGVWWAVPVKVSDIKLNLLYMLTNTLSVRMYIYSWYTIQSKGIYLCRAVPQPYSITQYMDAV